MGLKRVITQTHFGFHEVSAKLKTAFTRNRHFYLKSTGKKTNNTNAAKPSWKEENLARQNKQTKHNEEVLEKFWERLKQSRLLGSFPL